MKAPQILVLLLWAALAEQILATVSTGRGSVQYQKQTDYGTYKFGYDTGDQGAHSFRQEHRGFDGVVHGRYGYTDANGKLRYVEYSAGPFGYRVKGDTGAEPSTVKIEEGYKVPSDPELSDLQVGLAKIKKDNLFGVPVSPYIKGYTHTTPIPQAAKVAIIDQGKSVHSIAQPPLVVVQPQQPVIVQHPQPQVIVQQPQPAVIVREEKPIVQQVIIPSKQAVSHDQTKSIFIEHPVQHDYFKGYIPPIPVNHPQLPPPAEIRINHQVPVVVPQKSGYLPPPANIKVVNAHLPQIFEKRVTPYNKVYVQNPPVHHHPQQIFQAPVGDHFTKGYVAPTPQPFVRVHPQPQKSIFTRVEHPQKSVYVDQPKSVQRIQPPHTVYVEQPKTIVRVEPPKTVYVHEPQKTVVVQQPQKTVYVKEPQKTVYVKEAPKTVVVHQPPKTVYVHEQPKTVYVKEAPKTVYVHQPPKTVYVQPPPKTVYITQQPKTVYVTQPPKIVRVEQPPKTVYVPSPPKTVYVPSPPKTVYVPSPPKTVYVPSPPKVVHVESPKTIVRVEPSKTIYQRPIERPCVRCRTDNQKGYFPHGISRQYIFANPVSPAVKGYTGIRTEPGRSGSYTRVQSSTGQRRGEEDLVWIPAPENRFRQEARYHQRPPAYAYAPY